jgi:hypothetical protein
MTYTPDTTPHLHPQNRFHVYHSTPHSRAYQKPIVQRILQDPHIPNSTNNSSRNAQWKLRLYSHLSNHETRPIPPPAALNANEHIVTSVLQTDTYTCTCTYTLVSLNGRSITEMSINEMMAYLVCSTSRALLMQARNTLTKVAYVGEDIFV